MENFWIAVNAVVPFCIYITFGLFAIPLTESVFGSEGVALASMMIAVVVPIYNVVAVVVLEYFRGGVPKIGQLAKNVLSNPMIMGAIVGFVFFGLHIYLPACVEKPVKAFSDLSTSLALFVLGSTLHFSSIRKNLKYLVSALGLKLVLIPSIIMVLAVKLQFRPVECFVLFAMFATPVAAASYPMAQNMGGDGELAGELVVTSTVVSVFTIFLWIYFLKSIGVF